MEELNQDNGPINPNLNRIEKARKEFSDKLNVPDGYIEVGLSTRGKIAAPELFYIRNFSPEDLMSLGMTAKEDLPIKLVKVLDSLIYNPKNDPKLSVTQFHEKEVIELLLHLYETFYTTIFTNQEWTLTKEDWEFLAQQYGGRDTEEFRNHERAIRTKQHRPVFDIDISQLDYHEVPDDIKVKARVDRKYGNKTFSAVFSLPKFGDFITLKYFIDSMYREEDRKYARLGEMIKFRKDAEKRLMNGENINIASIPQIPKADYDKYKEYENDKMTFSITASKALYLYEFDGQIVYDWPLEKKLELARDARLDYSTFNMVQDHFNKLQFGLKEEITVHDPIMNKVVQRKYSFQLLNLLTAIRTTGTVETTISAI